MKLTFEGCVFDSDTRQVFRNGRATPLSPKAFALLEILIRSRPRALSKAEIREYLWPATFVSEANLSNLVVELRAALGDAASRPRIIRTAPRFGYAFSADAEETANGEARSSREGDLAYRLIWGRREVALDFGENLIGRDRESMLWIDDESVSRRHARIAVDDGGATIEDLRSKNGTFLGGKRIRGARSLADRDVVKIGPASIVFRAFRKTGSTASSIKTRGRR